MVAALWMEVCYNLSQDGGKGTSVFFYLLYQNTYSGCSHDYDCQQTDPTKRRCMRSTGMCYECMTSADCTPPNTCDPPPDGDGTCGFELGLLIISKDRWRKRDHTPSSLWPMTESLHLLALMILGSRAKNCRYQTNGFIICIYLRWAKVYCSVQQDTWLQAKCVSVNEQTAITGGSLVWNS